MQHLRAITAGVAGVTFLALGLVRPVALDAWLFFPLDLPGWKYEEAEAISDVLAYLIAPAIALVVAAWAAWRRHWWGLGGVALLNVWWMAATWVWKPLIGRERPPWVDLQSPAYPSGHTTMAIVLTGSLLIMAPRKWSIAAIAVIGGLTGWYRVAGSVHWASDIFGAIAWSTLALVLVAGPPFRHPDADGVGAEPGAETDGPD